MKLLTTICIVFILLFIAILPTLLSTKKGTQLLTSTMNTFMEGTIEVEDLELSWLGIQKATHLNYKNKEGSLLVQFDALSTATSLFRLLFTQDLADETVIEYVSVHYHQKDSGTHSFTLPIKKLSGPLYVHNGLVTLEKEGTPTSYIKNIHVEMNPQENRLYIKAEAIQTPYQGTLLVNGTLGEEAKIVATLTNFPLMSFALFEKTKWIPEALGPELSGKAALERHGEVT